jgi:lipooligosaccharide transport system ATP-binding protein
VTRDGEVVLRVAGLRKRYGDNEVVRGLDFEIRRGECFGLLGPNGAGKTTTLRCCLGLIDPDGGTIEMVGLPVPQVRARRAHPGRASFHRSTTSIPDFTVTETCRSTAAISASMARRCARGFRSPRVCRSRQQGGNGIRTLSGGMKRRLTLARALVNDPELLILDEPSTGPRPAGAPSDLGRSAPALDAGKTILLTTHFMDEAERLATRLAVIDHGKMIASDSRRARDRDARGTRSDRGVWRRRESVGEPARPRARITRVEQAGETAFCYATDAHPLLAALADAGVRYLHRPANLEDLFISSPDASSATDRHGKPAG